MADHYPQGICEQHQHRGAYRHVIWWRVGLIGLVLIVALFGLLGGAPAPSKRTEAAAAILEVTTPDRLRNGMFYETDVAVLARQPIADAVVAVPVGYWRDMTVNTMVPAAAEEESKDGEFRFHFGPLAAGDTLNVKMDGQLNPTRYANSSGPLRLLDGERELAAVPLTLKVIP